MKKYFLLKAQDTSEFAITNRKFKKAGITYNYIVCGEQKIYDKYEVGYHYYYAVFFNKKTKEVNLLIDKIKTKCKLKPTKHDKRINHANYDLEY